MSKICDIINTLEADPGPVFSVHTMCCGDFRVK